MANRNHGLSEKENRTCTASYGRLQNNRRHSGKTEETVRRNYRTDA